MERPLYGFVLDGTGGNRAVDLQHTKKCPPCGMVRDRLNGDEIFNGLVDRFSEFKRLGGEQGLDDWLESQVPWQIRREPRVR